MPKARFKHIALVLPLGTFFDRAFAQLSSLCTNLGSTSARVPVEFSPATELGKACSQIEQADLALVDISGRNPNTLYLAGYAHGIGRKVLFASQHGEDLPFDRQKHDLIIYHANLDLLEKGLDTFLQTGATPEAQAAPAEPATSANADAKARFQTIFGDIMSEFEADHPGDIYLENDKTFVLVEQDLELALVQALARRARELGLRIKLL